MYTSGLWNDYYVNSLDSLTSFWLPNTHYFLGDEGLEKYNIADTRLVYIGQRTMITLNSIHPNVYMVSKVLDMAPQGVIKLSLKLDDLDLSRDNVDLLLCDYYNDTGDIVVDKPTPINPDTAKTSTITYMQINADGELEPSADEIPSLALGQTYYFTASFSDVGVDAQFRVLLNDDSLSEEERIAIERLMILDDIDNNTVSLRPAKSKKLPGLKFILNVCDLEGNYSSSINLEVAT